MADRRDCSIWGDVPIATTTATTTTTSPHPPPQPPPPNYKNFWYNLAEPEIETQTQNK